jgi:hypothetical protein
MVRRSTWIVLGVFAIVVGFAVVFQRYQANQTANTATTTPTTAPEYLYNLSGAEVNDIKISDNQGSTIDLYLDPTSSQWAIRGIPADQADASKIQSLSDQLTSIQVEDALTQTVPLGSIGLESPAYTITLTTSDNTQLVTDVGMQTAIGTGYYVQNKDGQVVIVNKTALDELLNLLNEPPLLPTATPSATPTGAMTPITSPGQGTPTP